MQQFILLPSTAPTCWPAARNVVVVVSRWYGGVLLGPSRFGIINNTARQLLEELGYIVGSGSGGSSSKGGGKGRKR